MDVFPSKQGRIEVICGPMFAGKTEELIRRLNRELYADRKVRIFTADERFEQGHTQSHRGTKLPADLTCYVPSKDARYIPPLLTRDVDVVAIDEGQFWGAKDEDLASVCRYLARQDIRVIVSGLDMDYIGSPFENMTYLMGMAEYVTKLSAVCVTPNCHEPATMSHRKTKAADRHLQGAGDVYIPLCRGCFYGSGGCDYPWDRIPQG